MNFWISLTSNLKRSLRYLFYFSWTIEPKENNIDSEENGPLPKPKKRRRKSGSKSRGSPEEEHRDSSPSQEQLENDPLRGYLPSDEGSGSEDDRRGSRRGSSRLPFKVRKTSTIFEEGINPCFWLALDLWDSRYSLCNFDLYK